MHPYDTDVIHESESATPVYIYRLVSTSGLSLVATAADWSRAREVVVQRFLPTACHGERYFFMANHRVVETYVVHNTPRLDRVS